MSGKDFLYSIKSSDENIRRKLEVIDGLRASAIGITARTDKEAVQSNGSQDKIGSIMAKVVDLEKELNLYCDDLADRREIAKKIIFGIERENYQNVLYDFFICNIPLHQIADVYDWTYKSAEHIKSRAVREFANIYENLK